MGRERTFLELGTRYGKWTILKIVTPMEKYDHTKYLCRCDCDDEIEVFGFALKNGKSTQCNHCSTKVWRDRRKNRLKIYNKKEEDNGK